MKKYFLPVVAVAIVAIIMASSFAMGASTPNADPSVGSQGVTSSSSSSPAAAIYRTINFVAAGRCAIYVITVSGYGVLQVDTADFNPGVYPDWWRATITVVYWGTGTLLTETASSAVGYPLAPPNYRGVAEMPVYAGLVIKVLISLDRSKTSYLTGTFPATCYIRFRYTGPAMAVTGPLAGF